MDGHWSFQEFLVCQPLKYALSDSSSVNFAPVDDSRNLHCFTRHMETTFVTAIVLKTWEARDEFWPSQSHIDGQFSTRRGTILEVNFGKCIMCALHMRLSVHSWIPVMWQWHHCNLPPAPYRGPYTMLHESLQKSHLLKAILSHLCTAVASLVRVRAPSLLFTSTCSRKSDNLSMCVCVNSLIIFEPYGLADWVMRNDWVKVFSLVCVGTCTYWTFVSSLVIDLC